MLLLGAQHFLRVINPERSFKLILMECLFDREEKIPASDTQFLLALE